MKTKLNELSQLAIQNASKKALRRMQIEEREWEEARAKAHAEEEARKTEQEAREKGTFQKELYETPICEFKSLSEKEWEMWLILDEEEKAFDAQIEQRKLDAELERHASAYIQAGLILTDILVSKALRESRPLTSGKGGIVLAALEYDFPKFLKRELEKHPKGHSVTFEVLYNWVCQEGRSHKGIAQRIWKEASSSATRVLWKQVPAFFRYRKESRREHTMLVWSTATTDSYTGREIKRLISVLKREKERISEIQKRWANERIGDINHQLNYLEAWVNN